ncbi:hypothetical protein SAMN04488122_4950 [Chitinophaga arvensicola]|uniref:Uncharacterized protein n=1 Tax=Chitinophaga arvensicola TaxID=29529 RepID=A0A1I0SAZ1_9BACT|nr:hypothetical protein SAMN04488122_4950 [Chitinophaga arvensicola]
MKKGRFLTGNNKQHGVIVLLLFYWGDTNESMKGGDSIFFYHARGHK